MIIAAPTVGFGITVFITVKRDRGSMEITEPDKQIIASHHHPQQQAELGTKGFNVQNSYPILDCESIKF